MFNEQLFESGPAWHSHFLHAAGRGRGGGFPFGHGGGRGFMGGGSGLPGGRRLSSDDLQLILLALLEARPAHGYELIRTLEEKSNGFYTPSPGVIYPALTYLDEIGQAEVQQEANRKLYQITAEGRQYLEANRSTVEMMLDRLSRIGHRMEQVREAFAGFDELDPKAADKLHRARHSLKQAMMRSRGANPQQTRRKSEILEKAAAEILSVTSRDKRP